MPPCNAWPVIEPGWKTTELWLAIAAIGIAAWLAYRGHDGAACSTTLTAGLYAAGRSILKAAGHYVAGKLGASIMAVDTTALEKTVETWLENTARAKLGFFGAMEPEGDALIEAMVPCLRKAAIIYGLQAITKLNPSLAADVQKIAAAINITLT